MTNIIPVLDHITKSQSCDIETKSTYIKPVPVKREEIKLNEKYFTPNYGGVIQVTVVKVGNNHVLVKKKKGDPFSREFRYIFDNANDCKRACREWEASNKKQKHKK